VYSANGRGGQHIKVVPDWNLIVVTTGGSFEFDVIAPLQSAHQIKVTPVRKLNTFC
jgi:hypothetical protein